MGGPSPGGCTVSILFSAANYDAGFIRMDLDLLRRVDEVVTVPPSRMPQPWFKARALRRARFAYGWFADLSNMDTGILCSLLHRPFVLSVAGYELADLPEIGYGLQGRRILRSAVRSCFRHARIILFLTEALRREALDRYPEAAQRMHVLPPAFDSTFWTPAAAGPRSAVTSVIAADRLPRFQVKGGPALLDVARRTPSQEFVVVGVRPSLQDELRPQVPPNVRFLGRISPEELRDQYRRSSVILQPSLREVFPNAVCEAMLCACIPVVSGLSSMRETVGDTGFIAPAPSAEGISTALAAALAAPDSLRERVRARVAERYAVETRFQGLQTLLESLNRPAA